MGFKAIAKLAGKQVSKDEPKLSTLASFHPHFTSSWNNRADILVDGFPYDVTVAGVYDSHYHETGFAATLAETKKHKLYKIAFEYKQEDLGILNCRGDSRRLGQGDAHALQSLGTRHPQQPETIPI